MIYRVSTAAAALFLLPANAPADPAAAFGVRESVESVSLSPDGASLIYVAPRAGQGSAAYSVNLATGASQLMAAADGNPQRLGGCSFVADDRAVCSVYGMVDIQGFPITVTRLFAVDSDGSDVKVLSELDNRHQARYAIYGGSIVDWLPDEDGAVLMGKDYIPEHRENTRIEQKKDGFGVERVDTRTLARRDVESAKRNASNYISDGRGTIRIMAMRPPQGATGQMGATIYYSYRAKGSDDWRTLGEYNTVTEVGIRPVAVDPDLDVAYIFEKTDGRDALYRMALDGSGRKELVASHPRVDIDGLIRIGRRDRVVGASFVTDKRESLYFDKELKALADSLSKALPGLPLISFIDSSMDESKLLMRAGSDTDPGRFYIYDKGARKLEEIMLSRPQLEGVKLAEVKPINYKAADGTMVPGYLTLPPGVTAKNLPAIVMPHGGPSARDEWGFDWLSQYYANRGYAVLQPNFRGSAGYGDAWFQKNGFQSWRTAIGDVNDAGRYLIAEGIADPAKLAVVGWSYGGYAALQSNVVAPDLFKAIIAIAPVTDLALLKEESRFFTNFALSRDFIGSGPHIREGSPAQNAEKIKAPVLMFHGDVDANVDVKESIFMKDKLTDAGKEVELVVYPKLDHYLEDSAVRTDMLKKSDAFLRASMGM